MNALIQPQPSFVCMCGCVCNQWTGGHRIRSSKYYSYLDTCDSTTTKAQCGATRCSNAQKSRSTSQSPTLRDNQHKRGVAMERMRKVGGEREVGSNEKFCCITCCSVCVCATSNASHTFKCLPQAILSHTHTLTPIWYVHMYRFNLLMHN